MGNTLTSIPNTVSLPIFGVGLTTLCLSLCFCCYLWQYVYLSLIENIIYYNDYFFSLRRDTLREKGYRKDQYMRCKVKNSVSFFLRSKKRRYSIVI
jgi:hypothetical protein